MITNNNNDDNDNDDDEAEATLSIAVVTASLQKYEYRLNSLTWKSIHMLKGREEENRGLPIVEVFKGRVLLCHLRVVLRLTVTRV